LIIRCLLTIIENMLAVIKTGGKQYIVQPGDKIEIERIKDKKEGDDIAFDEVLLMEKGNKIEIGTPLIKAVKVTAKIVEEFKGKKKIVFKYKSKTRYKVKTGHRQNLMKVEIGKIED